MTGITSNRTKTAIIVNSTAPLLMNELHALDNVVFVIAVQSATVEMLLSKVIAINPTRTITAILILRIRVNHNQFDHSVYVYYISSPPFIII